jgi:cysteinyl-tRNA synthetase
VVADLLDKRHGHSVTDERIFRAHGAVYEEEFLADMKELGVRMPDVLTRVTDYIEEIVQFVRRIESNGLAYESNGSIYFNTQAFAERGFAYGKLEPWSVGDGKLLKSGEGALADKRDRKASENDFALWKLSKPGEPSWDSPWGRGRPGWHIECSAMASDLFGDNMDIHSGGSDLRFPHHDNELAQSEAHFGCKQWVNYFLHSGHLHIDGLKMSKSLKNFITIREALQDCSPRQMRLYFVGTWWWSVMDFDRKDGMTEIKNKEKTLLRFFENVHQIYLDEQGLGKVGSSRQKWDSSEKELHEKFLKAQEAVHAALLNNFDTPEVLKQLFDVVREANAYINLQKSKSQPPKALLLHKIASYIAHILGVMGIEFPEHGYGGSSASATASAGNKEILDVFAAFRKEVRTAAKEKKPPTDFLQMTDRLRDEVMPELGIRLEDDGVNPWTAVSADVLKKEIADKKRLEAVKVADKKKRRRVVLVRDIKNYEDARQEPTAIFNSGAYSKFDEQGVPTHDSEGKELSKSARGKLQKEFQKRQKDHTKFRQLLEQDPEFLDKLRNELAEIDSYLAAHAEP